MNIVILTAIYPSEENPGHGAFVQVQEHNLRRHGQDVRVVLIRGGSTRAKYMRGWQDLMRVIAHQPVDVVHAHYSYAALIARLQRRVPLVMTLHGSDLHGNYDGAGNRSRWADLDKWLSQGLAVVCDAVIVQSREMASSLPRSDVFVLPMEIDLHRFAPLERTAARQQLGLEPQRRYLLFAANPAVALKGFTFAGQVYERLKQQFRDLDWLVIYKEPQERLALYLNAADALIFPSTSEGSPVLIKQAMACNLPIVATGVGDIPELFEGVPGYVVAERQIEPFVEHLAAMLATPQRTNGRIVAQRYSPEATYAQLMQVYAHAISRFQRRVAAT